MTHEDLLPLRDVIDCVPIRFYAKGLDHAFVYINAFFEKELIRRGIITSRTDAIGLTDDSLFTQMHATAARDDENTIVSTCQSITGKEESETWKNGDWRRVVTSKYPWHGRNGEVIGTYGFSQDITDFQRYKELFAQAAGGIWSRDFHRGTVWVEKRWREALGYTEAEIGDNPASWKAKVHPDDIASLERSFRLHLRGVSDIYEHEYRLKANDGTWRWVAVRGKAIFDKTGRPVAISGTHHDITNLKSGLADNQERFVALMDAVNDGIFFKNADGLFTLVNATLARWAVGVDSPDDLKGKDDTVFVDSIPNYGTEYSRAQDKEVFESGQATAETTPRRIHTKTGDRMTLVSKAPVMRDGRVIEVLGITKDATDMYERQQLLQNILDALPVSVFVKDHSLVLKLCNKHFADQHKMTPDELKGKDDYDLSINRDYADRHRYDDKRVLATGKSIPWYRETQWLKGCATCRVLYTTKIPLFAGDGRPNGVLGLYQDVNEILGREEVRAELRSRISRSISHCLRTWLSTLELNIASVRRDPANTVLLDHLSNTVAFFKATVSMAINSVTLDRPERTHPVDVGSMIREITSLLCDPRIQSDLEPGIVVNSLAQHLENAVLEIIANAQRFAPLVEKGGLIRVSTRTQAAMCEIIIEDNGPGLPKTRSAEEIFQEFVTTDSEHVGLGLSYARAAVQLCGGDIAVRKKANGRTGAVFVLMIPVIR
jgi:PAS domain S-box-containing protein